MTRYYVKNSRELTFLDRLRLLNGGFHKVNLMTGNPASIAFEEQQQREEYLQRRRNKRNRW